MITTYLYCRKFSEEKEEVYNFLEFSAGRSILGVAQSRISFKINPVCEFL
jgi:hypothetical protein